ncbi:DUF6109 family natural product biosynthesis protein [Hyalangium gracile]|uniref:DUF6109 family natural product biosynthesis protein n=1 Tax=Hyalangium gracile TaxID=394092 RepID=UPI001CCFFF0B|nr:DUF6109 family natural product biosynthesis protein [Hyalangium gracile]
MARQEGEERQHRRWLEDARKYLTRGELEAGLPALLRLPPSQREQLLPRGAELFRQAVQELHRRGAWGALATLAARADVEPRLVEQGVEPEEARATYWSLLWAASRAREWARAERLWQPLAPTAREHAPRLAVAMEAWVSSQGTPEPRSVAPALACLPPVDARLGVEPARTHVSLSPPRSLEEVEEALLALYALEPFPRFASRVEAWGKELPAEVARATWRQAGLLAARELWLRAEHGQGSASLLEPAVLLARAAREAGDARELSEPVLQALRVVTSRLPPEGISSAQEAEAWCALAQAAALQPEARLWVVGAVSELRFSGAGLPRALRLYQALLALAPDAALWARAVQAWDAYDSEARSAPEWLQTGLRQLIETGVPAVLAWLRRAHPSERTELVECVAFTHAPELVESWVDASWELAGEELRPVLSDAISILLERSRDKGARQKLERMLQGARSLDDAARMLMDTDAPIERLEALMGLSAEGLRIWRRFGSRVLTYRAEFLREAVRQASSDSEAWEAISRYLDAHGGDPAYLETLQLLDVGERKELARRVMARWLERRANDVQALAEAVVAAGRTGAPCEYLHPLLAAFLASHLVQPSSAPTPSVKRALELARKHGVRLPKRRAARKKKPSTKAATERTPRAKAKARKKRSPGQGIAREQEPQLDLLKEEEEENSR